MAGSLKGKTSVGTDKSENTPLLGSSTEGPALSINEGEIISNGLDGNGVKHQPSHHHEDDKPLPKLQIFVLCYARMIEPIAYFGIFPFINAMIYETGGLSKADVGFYTGLIESLFSLAQMMLMIFWGHLSDRIGRKPVLIVSLFGVSIFSAMFGLSKAIWQMILFRCMAGIFSGTIVTIRTMIAEHSTKRTQARAFSFFAFAGNVGLSLGPTLGGALADPARNIGGFFKDIPFFLKFPYSLSTFCTGTIGLSGVIACVLFVKETAAKKVKGDDVVTTEEPMTVSELLKAPGVAIVVALYGHVSLLGIAYTVICPVFWYEPPEFGGYGFSPLQISMFLAGIGISQAIWLLLVFPPLQRKYGTGNILRVCYYLWPIFFAAAPVCNMFLRWGGKWNTAFWIVAPMLQIGGSGVSMAFTGVQLALNDIAPNQQSLGTLNALALTLVSGIRAFGPVLFTSIFAVGIKRRILSGYLIWPILIGLAIMGSVGIRWLPKEAEGKIDDGEE